MARVLTVFLVLPSFQSYFFESIEKMKNDLYFLNAKLYVVPLGLILTFIGSTAESRVRSFTRQQAGFIFWNIVSRTKIREAAVMAFSV